ncbi:MAG: DNA polymerase III subunit delta [Oscillospiraceae bacterium]|nr:DNA polymerase III subunit delta [Oscillospiraceae bacterium]
MNLDTLAGNASLKKLLGAAGGRDLSHAYIISGPAGSGRRTLALCLAQALLCSGSGARPCGTCVHCRKAAAGIHPDLIRVGGDGKDVKVDAVRSLRSDAYIRPNEGDRKVYLVENAGSMNSSAQNALLKLLEDGPAYAAFLMITGPSETLLETVRSRCVELTLSPLTYGETLDELRRRFPDQPEEALAAAAVRCEGILGAAVEELSGAGSEDSRGRELALAFCGHLAGRKELPLVECAVGMEKCSREELETFAESCGLLLRDALVGGGELDPDRKRIAESLAASLTKSQLLRLKEVMDQVGPACAFHVGGGHLMGQLCAECAEIIQ